MSFVSVRLPEVIEQGAEGGPVYSTSLAQTTGGHEYRQGNWSQPLFRWNVASGLTSAAEFATLLAFFHARQGRLYGFRFKDWSDYEATAQPVTAGQLYKGYTSGGVTLYRKITRPVSGTVTITGGGTLNYETGVVTGGSPTTWTGQFDVPVRFDSDEFRLTMEHVDIGNAQLDVVSIRE